MCVSFDITLHLASCFKTDTCTEENGNIQKNGFVSSLEIFFYVFHLSNNLNSFSINWHKNCLVCYVLHLKSFIIHFLNFRILVMSLFTKYFKDSKKIWIAWKPKNVEVLWAYYFEVFVFYLFVWEINEPFVVLFTII